MAKLTGTIITLDEEQKIADCIRSLQRVADEVVVVDSLSSDGTVDIARSLGARVVLQEWLGDGPQKNLAADCAANDWILHLDADERLDDEAVAAIQALGLDAAGPAAYGLRRKNFIGRRWIRWAGYYPDVVHRMFDRRRTRWDDKLVHTRLRKCQRRRLPGHLLHYSFRDYDDFVRRTFKYSAECARMFDRTGRRPCFGSAVLHGLAGFVKRYLLQRGVLGGRDGLTVSLIAATGSYMKYAELAEIHCERRRSDGTSSSVPAPDDRPA